MGKKQITHFFLDMKIDIFHCKRKNFDKQSKHQHSNLIKNNNVIMLLGPGMCVEK